MAPFHWNKLGRKKVWVVAGAMVLVVVVVTAVGLGMRNNRPDTADAPDQAQTPTATQSPMPTATQAPDADPSQSGGNSAGNNGEFVWQDSPAQGNQGTGGQGGEAQGISFPYAIGDTGLTLKKLGSYDGIYIEDGSDTQVSNVCVILLENTRDTVAEYAKVSLTLEGRTLTFEASAIPPKATVVVQESQKAAWSEGTCYSCTADVARLDAFQLSQDQVKVEDNGDGSLTVTNLTDQEIPAVRLFYKFYMPEEDVYVGGIAYTAKITELAGKASVTVTPSHYVSGSAKVLMVRTYDQP